jgi:ketosteroid isomerase-like protein
MTATEVVLRFVDRINAGDVEGLAALMTDDHRFIDSLGAEAVGRERMRRGWEEYLRMVPDYRLEVREAFQQGPVVVLLGVARGTYARDGTLRAEDAWETPSAWRAVVRGGRVAEWQVYADNEPLRQKMREGSP